jgi:ribonucleoside-diphosphate reductase alpha chain
LRNLGLWEGVKDQILEKQGDIADIAGIPQHIKDVYKISFSVSPYAVIEIAARAQKWIDQAMSRNMYLETRDIDETMQIYKTAWEKGLKCTYYLHMKPRHTAEQSTVNVNKAQKMGKIGFGAIHVEKKSAPASFAAPLQKSLEMEAAPTLQPVLQVGEPTSDSNQSVGLAMVAEAMAAPTQGRGADPIGVGLKKPAFSTGFGSIKLEEKVPVMAAVASAVITETEAQSAQAVAPVASQDTVAVNPPAGGGKPFVCPVDPDELAACEACQ